MHSLGFTADANRCKKGDASERKRASICFLRLKTEGTCGIRFGRSKTSSSRCGVGISISRRRGKRSTAARHRSLDGGVPAGKAREAIWRLAPTEKREAMGYLAALRRYCCVRYH